MDDTTLWSIIALCVGVAFAIASAVVALLRGTRGVNGARRLLSMLHLAYSAIKRVTYRRSVAAVIAGVVSCLGSLFVVATITILIIRAEPPEFPPPKAKFERIDHLATIVYDHFVGATRTLWSAVIIGFVVGVRVGLGRRRASKPEAVLVPELVSTASSSP